MFLTADDLIALTGRRFKSKQIEVLRNMKLPFHVNACGKPVVPVAAIEGRKEPVVKTKQWEMPD